MLNRWPNGSMMCVVSAALLGGVVATGCATAQSPANEPAALAAPARTPVERPAIVSAAEWGSVPQPIADERRQVVTQLTVHHAGELWKPTDDPVKKLKGLQKYGQTQKNWPDLPYHFMIAPDGRVFEGRSMDYEPETNTNYITNGHVGVNLWGNFEEQRVSREQLVALVDVLAWLCDKNAIDPATIAGHKDRLETSTAETGKAKTTLCPGRDFHRYILDGDIARWVEQRLAGQTPAIAIKEPLPDGPLVEIPKLFEAAPAPSAS